MNIYQTIRRKVQNTVRDNHNFFNQLHQNTLLYRPGFLVICDMELKIQRGSFIVSRSVVEILICHSELFADTAAVLLPLIPLVWNGPILVTFLIYVCRVTAGKNKIWILLFLRIRHCSLSTKQRATVAHVVTTGPL
jgi:hypothetical protein